MPEKGFSWLASNISVLEVWLALLNEDLRGAGTLGAILDRADSIAIKRYIDEFMLSKNATKKIRMGTFIDNGSESVLEKEHLVGAEFIKWLTEALDSGKLIVNKAPLFMVPGGMLMSADVFKYFVREHSEFKSWQAVQTGFLKLGLHKNHVDGGSISRFEQPNSQQIHSGVVFNKFAVALPASVKVNSLNNGKVTTCQALEVVGASMTNNQFVGQKSISALALQKLSADGKWQNTATAGSSFLRPGNING